jgi:hypothetical protein
MKYNMSRHIAPIAFALMPFPVLLILGGRNLVPPDVIAVFVAGAFGVVSCVACALFVWRGFLSKTRLGAAVVVVVPGLIYVAYSFQDDPGLLAGVFGGFGLAAGVASVFAYAYPDPQAAPAQAGGKTYTDDGRILLPQTKMPSQFGAPRYIPNWMDPITGANSGPGGRRFAVYACPNEDGHPDEPFFLSESSWKAKNFLCPSCNVAILSDGWDTTARRS